MSKVFQFPTSKKRTAKPKSNITATAFAYEKDAEPPIQLVQGIKPGSVQEWRTALALYRLKIPFEFQKSIDGGRRYRGGQVVDFWVYTQPFPTPVFVQGAYWHNRATENEDNLKQQRVQRIYKGQVAENLLLAERDLSSVQAAYTLLRRELIGW